MNNNNALEFNKIIDMLVNEAVGDEAKKRLSKTAPIMDEAVLKSRLLQTTEAKKIINALGDPPLSQMSDIKKSIGLAVKGAMLSPNELMNIAIFISGAYRLRRYLARAHYLCTSISLYEMSFNDNDLLLEKIEGSIRENDIADHASSTLKSVRREIAAKKDDIKKKIETIMRANKAYLADDYFSYKDGRYVLPIKKEHKNKVSGSVISISQTGSTIFIEPEKIKHLMEELSYLEIEEENEKMRILYELSGFVAEQESYLLSDISLMSELDCIFARGKLSILQNAVPPIIGTERRIEIIGGRHPLIDKQICVPIDFKAGGDVRGIIITGPNTGGKTAALKTVGLFSLMAQSGLHIPAKEGSYIAMFDNVLCDIGDGQSILESLSTFSAHIVNVIDILEKMTVDSLVLMDELGSGTDPAEGMGIAIAVLERLAKSNAIFAATTHYPQVKEFAKKQAGVINARMEFDKESLKPLYKLTVGEAGESCALYIAKKLGMGEELLNAARHYAYGEEKAENELILLKNEEKAEIKKSSIIKKEKPKINSAPKISEKFKQGDSVMVYPQKEMGIVYKGVGESGEFIVLVKEEFKTFMHKRLKLISKAEELYPQDYDMSIVFDSVEKRKARHQMQKKYNPDLILEYKED